MPNGEATVTKILQAVSYLKFRGLNKKVTVEQTPYSTLYLGRSLNLLIHPQFLGVRRESSVKN